MESYGNGGEVGVVDFAAWLANSDTRFDHGFLCMADRTVLEVSVLIHSNVCKLELA